MREGGVAIHLNAAVQEITAEGNRATGIALADGSKVEADAVVAAVPSLLFKKLAPSLPEDYAAKLDHVRWQGAVCMVVTMSRSLSPIYWMTIGDREICRTWALNEASVEKGTRGGVLDVRIEVDGHAVSAFGCDGVLVATPTGSTAYTFSAGGPILWPDLEAMLVVPNNAHALFARPMVTSPTARIAIEAR